jgi:hypothetical protein
MKNLNNLLQDSNVLELNSVEMEEIVGGSWLSRLLHKIADLLDSYSYGGDFIDEL